MKGMDELSDEEMNLSKSPSVLQIRVSKPTNVDWNGVEVSTAIFKTLVDKRVKVRRLNLDGDEQADLSVHGGPDKAVYAYPIEQYAYWKEALSDREFEWGSFGENLTVEGFDENSLCIGDRLKIGSAVFAVSQPRMPCYKLGIRLNDSTMVRRFYRSGKWGFYLSVLEEGEIETGNEIQHLGGDGNGITLANVSSCFIDPNVDDEMINRVLHSNLAEQMKGALYYRLRNQGN